MADLDEIVEETREGGKGPENEAGRGSVDGMSTKRRRSRKRRNSSEPEGPVQSFPSGQDSKGTRKENGGGGRNDGQRVDGGKLAESLSTQDLRSEFYGHYRKESEEYDEDFMKKYEEDLDTTLIFAGLFSAVTSAFIIDVQSQLQPDTGDETVALLRVLIYKIDNTTFGNDAPTLPQWTGPPRAIVQVQAILYASLAATLLSAFLAMLGKQWLNRYASTDMRGTAIERSQNRQRKLDGIVAWYFDYVMQSLPLMLQIALLLLGCALSRYLWEINVTVASVVLGVTSFGAIFYLFIVVAGVASESCPYQTPGSHALRYLGPKVRKLRSAASSAISTLFDIANTVFLCVIPEVLKESRTIKAIKGVAQRYQPWWSRSNIIPFLMHTVLVLPRALAIDICYLGLAIILLFVAFCVGVCYLGYTIVRSLARFFGRAYNWLHGAFSTPEPGSEQQTTVQDLPCISWILQTSLDKAVRLPTLKHLVTMEVLPDFDPTLVEGCFGVFIGCISVKNRKVAIVQGLEELATLSATCFLRTFHHLSLMNPTSSVLADLRQRYNKIFPFGVEFWSLSFYPTMAKIHDLLNSDVRWGNYKPFTQGHIPAAWDMAEAARVGYQKTRNKKVPRRTLHFAFRSLSLDPPPPASVIACCLSIIAIDLGCDVSNIRFMDQSARVREVSSLIIRKLETMVEAEDRLPLQSKHKAITALLPYGVWQERDGQPEMFDTILHAIRASRMSGFTWHHIDQFLSTLLSEASPRAVVLVLPQIPFYRFAGRGDLVQCWAATATAVPYTEEVARGVVDTLLQIASDYWPVEHIPVSLWSWLTKQPSLPPICEGRSAGTRPRVVRIVQELKDIEVLKSYLFVVWSEWNTPYARDEMHASIRGDFSGIGMGHHRADLIRRLDYILKQLDRGLEYLEQYNPYLGEDRLQERKGEYQKLRETLLEIDSQSRTTFMCALPPLCP